MKKHALFVSAVSLLVLSFFSCQKDMQSSGSSANDKVLAQSDSNNPDEVSLRTVSPSASGGSFVYTESNDKKGNTVIIYKQNSDGTLTYWKEVNTGGKGLNESLGSQGAVCISENHQWLLAVNAGSNNFSLFQIGTDGDLALQATVSSYGRRPTSITMHRNTVYVLNDSSSTITGFIYKGGGYLDKIPNTPYSLSTTSSDGAQVSFQPDGNGLVVTEKVTNLVDVFTLSSEGKIISAVYNKSKGEEPFGFCYGGRDKQFLLVSNAYNGAAGAASCTSYKEVGMGVLKSVGGEVKDYGTAACWLTTAKYGYYAFAGNAASNTIASYRVSASGALSLIDSAAASSAASHDLLVSTDNRFVYNINLQAFTISEFARKPGGKLETIGTVKAPEWAVGLATF